MVKEIKIGKRISLSFSNRWLYTFIAIGIIAIIGVGVYAFTGPNGVGHDLSEIQPCAAGKILQTNADGTAWTCVNMPSGSTDTNAGTICSGTYKYLNGDGECRDVRSDGDLYDTDTNTHGSLVCTDRNSQYITIPCTTTCSSFGEVPVWERSIDLVLKCRCCKVV